jgi:hypothetical protein
LVLKDDGTLWGWGYNENNQVYPNNQIDAVSEPVKIEVPEDTGKILGNMAGDPFSGFFTEHGDLWVLSSSGSGSLRPFLRKIPELKVQLPNNWEAHWTKILV